MFNLQFFINNKKYLFFALSFIVFISIFIIIFFTRHYINYGFIPIYRNLMDTAGISYYLNYNDIKQLSIFDKGINNLINVDSSGLTNMKGTVEFFNLYLNNNNSPFTVDLYMHYSKTKNIKDFTSYKIASKNLKDIKYVSTNKNIIFDISTDISKLSFKYFTFSLYISSPVNLKFVKSDIITLSLLFE